ncbi:MAG: class I SAM-dependent methyltransferase [Verrucomicrobiota bacterium]|jgi:predicted O-methyltransferase YrrM
MIPGIMEFPILPYYFAVRQARKIDGWLTNGEARFLFSAARLVTAPRIIVEIGAWHGKSTVLLCRGAQTTHRVPIYSVDLFEIGGNDAADYRKHTGRNDYSYLELWKRNVRRARGDGLVHPIVGCSWDKAAEIPGEIGLLFVDGDHTEAGVRNDWNAYQHRLAPECVVMFHDYFNEKTAVRKVVDEIRPKWNFGTVGTSAVLWRTNAS